MNGHRFVEDHLRPELQARQPRVIPGAHPRQPRVLPLGPRVPLAPVPWTPPPALGESLRLPLSLVRACFIPPISLSQWRRPPLKVRKCRQYGVTRWLIVISTMTARSPVARLLGLGRSSSERSATPHSQAGTYILVGHCGIRAQEQPLGSPGTQTQTVTVASRAATPPRSQTPHQSLRQVSPPVIQQQRMYPFSHYLLSSSSLSNPHL